MNYLSISEFANSAGVSTQSVYKRLQTDLKEFTTIKNGKKVISDEALKLYYKHNNKQQKRQQNDNELQQVVKLLQEQLKAKDEQIARLQNALELQQQLNAATLQTFKALPEQEIQQPSSNEAADIEKQKSKKKHWWQK